MSGNNGVLRLFDEIAEHDSGDDLWLLGLGEGGKTTHQDSSYYQQRTPSPGRNVIPSPLCNIPIREEENRRTPLGYSFSPAGEEGGSNGAFNTTMASSSQGQYSHGLVTNGTDLSCVDRGAASSSLSLADSDGAEMVAPMLSPVDYPSESFSRQTAPPLRRPPPLPISRPNGVTQTQQRFKSSVASPRAQDLRPSQPAPQPSSPAVIQASQLAGCLQLVNGQLVVQAQLQQVQTPNGLMTVAVLPSLNRLQMAQNGATQLTATPPSNSVQNQQPLPPLAPVAVDKSKKPRSIMPRPLNGNSRKRPPVAAVHPKPVQAPATPMTPSSSSSSQSAMIVRLSSENAEIVNRLSGEIQRLQTEQTSLGLDHSERIRQLEQQRARIFGEALRAQHSVQTPQLAPSPPPPPPPPPVSRQPNQRIVSINGQSYLMFDGHPLALHSASESAAVSSPSVSSSAALQSNESLPPAPNGPSGSVVPERTPKRSARPSRSSVTFSKSTTHSANAKLSEAQIAKRQLQLKAERAKKVREGFETLSSRLEKVDTVTPFCNLNDVVERLLPFHVYDEPELNADALRHFDDNYLRYSARLMYQKKMLEHRFRAALFREAMTPFAEKAEESLLAYMHSRHEQELLDRDRELAKSDLEGFVAQSEICAKGRVERMKEEAECDISNRRRSISPTIEDNERISDGAGDLPPNDYEMEEEEEEEEEREMKMKSSPAEWSSRPQSEADEGERPSLAARLSPPPSPVRIKLRLESPIRKKKKKRRKRRRHSPSSPDPRALSPVQQRPIPIASPPPPSLPAESNSLKLRFRLAANGAADLVRLDGFVDPPKVVPKLKIRLENPTVRAMMTSVASDPRRSTTVNGAPFNGLEQSDSESDSPHSISRTRSSSNGLGSDAGVAQFSPDSDAHFSEDDDDDARLRQLTNSLIERLNVETLLNDACSGSTRKMNGGGSSPPVSGLELSGSEHSD